MTTKHKNAPREKGERAQTTRGLSRLAQAGTGNSRYAARGRERRQWVKSEAKTLPKSSRTLKEEDEVSFLTV